MEGILAGEDHIISVAADVDTTPNVLQFGVLKQERVKLGSDKELSDELNPGASQGWAGVDGFHLIRL